MTTDFNLLARKIIEKNQYMTLGTNGWVSPVCYVFDAKFNLYWASPPNARHSQNIAKNPAISVAIFDSRQDVGTGVGLQIEGMAKKVTLAEFPEVLKTYFGHKWPYGNLAKTFLDHFKQLLQNKAYSFYKFTPQKVWLNDPNSEVDRRIEIPLDEIINR
ncbi:pyridoxamine 5'-phosphate oxidase family protein [Candidatus Microgenomates bacterium]|nr:pyridoxamine 5'-phosphate oxidase family protein [Candidatus Microgenomates bacterium]